MNKAIFYLFQVMNKSIILVILVLISFAHALHMQRYGPSTPGGTNTNTNTNTNTGVMINGKPYVYTGPFTLVCYYQNSTQAYRWDTCYNAQACLNMLNDYRQCQGKVEKFNVK